MASNKMVCALASRVPTHLEGEREREREQKACVSGSLSSFVLRWHQAFFHTHSLSLAVLIVYNLLFNETDSVCPRKKKKRKKKIKKTQFLSFPSCILFTLALLVIIIIIIIITTSSSSFMITVLLSTHTPATAPSPPHHLLERPSSWISEVMSS